MKKIFLLSFAMTLFIFALSQDCDSVKIIKLTSSFSGTAINLNTMTCFKLTVDIEVSLLKAIEFRSEYEFSSIFTSIPSTERMFTKETLIDLVDEGSLTELTFSVKAEIQVLDESEIKTLSPSFYVFLHYDEYFSKNELRLSVPSDILCHSKYTPKSGTQFLQLQYDEDMMPLIIQVRIKSNNLLFAQINFNDRNAYLIEVEPNVLEYDTKTREETSTLILSFSQETEIDYEVYFFKYNHMKNEDTKYYFKWGHPKTELLFYTLKKQKIIQIYYYPSIRHSLFFILLRFNTMKGVKAMIKFNDEWIEYYPELIVRQTSQEANKHTPGFFLRIDFMDD